MEFARVGPLLRLSICSFLSTSTFYSIRENNPNLTHFDQHAHSIQFQNANQAHCVNQSPILLGYVLFGWHAKSVCSTLGLGSGAPPRVLMTRSFGRALESLKKQQFPKDLYVTECT